MVGVAGTFYTRSFHVEHVWIETPAGLWVSLRVQSRKVCLSNCHLLYIYIYKLFKRDSSCVCVCARVCACHTLSRRGFVKCRGVWHSYPITRNDAVDKSGKGNLAIFLYLQRNCWTRCPIGLFVSMVVCMVLPTNPLSSCWARRRRFSAISERLQHLCSTSSIFRTHSPFCSLIHFRVELS